MDLSKVILDLIEAQNEHNSKTFADQFSEDALVYDEGKRIMEQKRSDSGMKQQMQNTTQKSNYLKL